MFQCHNLHWTGKYALGAFDAVKIKIANFQSSAVVGRELHWTDTGTTFTFHLTDTRYVDVRKGLGKWCLLGSHPA